MALQDTITTEIIPNYTRILVDNVGQASPVWEYMFETIDEVPGGSEIIDQINYQLSKNADNFGGGVAPVEADFINTATAAVQVPAYYWFSAIIPDTFKIIGRGEGEIINLFGGQYDTAMLSIQQKFGADIWSDGTQRNGAPIINGIRAVCTYDSDPGGGPYGGITRVGATGPFTAPVGNAFWNGVQLTVNGGSQTTWIGNVNPGTSTTLSMQSLMALITACTVGIYRPKLLVGDPTFWTALHNLIVQTTRQAPLQEEGGVGYPQISFSNIPAVMDVFAPSGYVAAINDKFQLCPWEEGFFENLPPVRPYNTFCTIYYCLIVLQAKHTRPNTMGTMSGITG